MGTFFHFICSSFRSIRVSYSQIAYLGRIWGIFHAVSKGTAREKNVHAALFGATVHSIR
jgi:hypothetical protein